jgi:hypothetical protein
MKALRGIANFWWNGPGLRPLIVFVWMLCGGITIALFPLGLFVWPYWISIVLLFFNIAWMFPLMFWLLDRGVSD